MLFRLGCACLLWLCLASSALAASRTISGTLYRPNGTAWSGGTLTIELVGSFSNVGQTVEKMTWRCITNAAGVLVDCRILVPDLGSATYKFTLPGGTTASPLLGAGATITLETIFTSVLIDPPATLPDVVASVGDPRFVNVGGDTMTGTLAGTAATLSATLTLPATTSAVTGVLFKGSDRFLHNFALAGTDGLNTFVGVNSGNFTLTGSTGAYGSYNTGIGESTLTSNTTGYSNVALGYRALFLNTIGNRNIAIGGQALLSTTTGMQNVGVGVGAGYALTTAIANTAVGESALASMTTGWTNVAIGQLSGYRLISGSSNTAVGVESLYGNIPDDQIVNGTFPSAPRWEFGAGWVLGAARATKNADGVASLSSGTDASDAYIDYGVGGNYRIVYTIADYSTGLVTASFGGVSDTARSANGTYTWNLVPTSYTTGSGRLVFTPTNTARLSVMTVSFIGTDTISASGNTAVGVGAHYMATTAVNNAAFGAGALRQSTLADGNAAFGVESLTSNGTGVNNTGIGMHTLYTNNAGHRNVALGFSAGFYETGSDKLFIDNAQRANEADGRVKALVYGMFDAAVANQYLTVNGHLAGTQSLTTGTLTPSSAAGYGPLVFAGGAYPALSLKSNAAGGRQFTIGSNESGGVGFLDFYDETAAKSRWRIDASGNFASGPETGAAYISTPILRVTTSSSPASNGACTAGEITWDASYVYVCIAANTWKRAALAAY